MNPFRPSTHAQALTRRMALALLPTATLLPWLSSTAHARTQIGTAGEIVGTVLAELAELRQLAPQDGVFLDEAIRTEAESRARFELQSGSNVFLGPNVRLIFDKFVAGAREDMVLDTGALVFDRPEDLPKIRTEIRSVFGSIGVRGTRFFAGPSRDVFGVFVDRGTVTVEAAGVVRVLDAGDGVDIPAPGAPPGEVIQWGQERIDEAFASVLG